MNAKARTARQTIKARRAEAAAAKKPHTLGSHCRLAGLEGTDLKTIPGALRAKGKLTGVTGTAVRMFRRTANGIKLWRRPVAGARRYTKAQFHVLAAAYNPRLPRLVEARATLLAY